MAATASTASSRRNSTAGASVAGGSRRGSVDSDTGFPFRLKKSKPVSQVKLVFMGKSMEIMLPQNDVDIYDGESIDGSFEAKNKNNWVQIFDMIDLTFNNLQQQNKELKRTVNELSSKVNKMVFHERKEESKNTEASKPRKATSDKPPEYNQSQVQEINKKVDSKIQRVEENILQWIDEETKVLKDNLEKDITSIRSEVDTKNIELNSKVQSSIHDLRDEVIEKVNIVEHKIIENQFENGNDFPMAVTNDQQEPGTPGTAKAIVDLKNKLHQNCNTLRFLCSEPLSVQFSMWNKNEMSIPRDQDADWRCVCFNWINCNVGGAIDDDGVSDLHTVNVPISGPYLLSLGGNILNSGGRLILRRNRKEQLLEAGRTDIVDLNEDDELRVFAWAGTRVKEVSLMGMLLRPRIFITPGTTF